MVMTLLEIRAIVLLLGWTVGVWNLRMLVPGHGAGVRSETWWLEPSTVVMTSVQCMTYDLCLNVEDCNLSERRIMATCFSSAAAYYTKNWR